MHKNIELFSKCKIACPLDFSDNVFDLITREAIFTKFSAPPLFHLNCCDLAALNIAGNSAGVTTSSRYTNSQFLSCAL